MERQSGALLIEVMIGLTVFAVGIFALMSSLISSQQGITGVTMADRALFALQSTSELLKGQDFDQIYNNFHDTNVAVPDLIQADGTAASVQINCLVDETNLPAEFGGLTDIDGNDSTTSTDCSTTYMVLPVSLSVTYGVAGVSRTDQMFVLLDDALSP